MFDRVFAANGIVHKPTKPYHPWTNGQAERMNRRIKEATTKAFHCPDLSEPVWKFGLRGIPVSLQI
jgi:hypothetical protein